MMIKVYCRTNLDLRNEVWPESLPALPNIGDRIQSATVWPGGFSLTLKVISVKWEHNKRSNEWFPVIELHIAQENWSIFDFYNWYAPLVHSSVSAFI